jgi:hypothetical protein
MVILCISPHVDRSASTQENHMLRDLVRHGQNSPAACAFVLHLAVGLRYEQNPA